MAVSGVSSSTSIYGNRNVISGLASGMDTESMIENAISAYKNKITTLTQKRTKTEWKQESYRSIINKMSVFMDKYTSYRSSNNLMSTSFFDQAVKTVAKGANADKITATGRSSSNIQVDRVRQLATAATYKLGGQALDGTTSSFGSSSVSAAADGTLNLDKSMTISSFSGNMTLAYGGSSALSYLTVDFDETKTYTSPQELADEINRQLETQSVVIGNKSYTGKELLNNVVKAEVKNGQITFSDPKNNNVYISSASDSVKKELLGGKELSSVAGKQVKTLDASAAMKKETMNTLEYLSSRNATMEITLDGVTKTVKLPGEDAVKGLSGADRDAAYVKAFQKSIDDVFGPGKLTVSDANGSNSDRTSNGIRFQFTTAQKGSTFSVSSSKGETLGFGDSERITSYLNTGKTLGELLKGKDGIKTNYDGKVDFAASGFEKAYTETKDADGNTVKKLATDASGNQLYSFRVNGKEIGQFNEDSTLSEVINAMNGSSDSGVKVNYSKLTNELTFTAKDTGAASRIDFSSPEGTEGDSLAAALFGVPGSYDENPDATYTKGQDAILEVSVNGTSLGEITRSTNDIELDGMTINLKGTFGYEYSPNYSLSINGAKYSAAGAGDDKLKLTNSETGAALKYSSGSSEEMKPFNGQEIYGKVVDGEMKFYVDDADGNTKELYAKESSTGKGAWFSIYKTSGTPAEVTMTEDAATAKKVATEGVTFETSSDADKIVDVVKQMVEDYNAMVTEIKNAYSTLPAQRSNGAYYEPLTSEDEEGMSESAIKNWEDKAKQGILFGDRDLAGLYTRLTSAVSMTGENGAALRAAGITVNYSNGLSTLEFDEDKFRTALNNDPDKVRDAFTASTETGAKSNGLMQALKQPLDMYGKTSGGKGILVEKAGSPLAASTMYTNTIQKELDRIDEQIEKWQDKMSDQVDYYTNQFSRLEQLIQQMNSQSSYFSQLMGG